MLKPLTTITGIPLQGGVNTRINKALLPFGAFSAAQNVRGKHPGFRKRPGQIKLHDTADSTNEVLSLYQFRKTRIDEKKFYAQMSDGDILEATNAPPTVATAAVFGSEVYSGSASQKPGSWSTLNDILFHSNGVDQHQVCAGDDNYPLAVYKFSDDAEVTTVPVYGTDMTTEAIDGLTSTAVILDSLSTYAAATYECIFICTPVPAQKLTWTVSLPNGTNSVGTLNYRKSDGTWADTSETDNTITTGKTLAKTGTMTWSAPSDEVPHYMFGITGYWYQWEVSVALDAEVEVTKITYGSDFNSLTNVWSGDIEYAVEAQYYDGTTYKVFDAAAVEIDDMAITTDKVYFATAEPIMGIYIDVGNKPNTTASTALGDVKFSIGTDTWTALTDTVDGTNGLKNSGWITWTKPTADPQPTQFQTSQFQAYWYYFDIDTAVMSDDVIFSIQTMPYYDIDEIGEGQCSAAWKDRMAYAFTRDNYVFISGANRPNNLNGFDFGILQAGDGRNNKPVAMRKFHNELMVFQEEKGAEGGCITLFQGYSPSTFGKLLVSDKIGTMNNKSVAVVDGVLTSTATDEKIKTLAFTLSRYGIAATDGITVSIISDDIQNYFDPTKTECIRKGYEDKMWLAYDSAFNVIRVGLVSGATATKPNIFPVFDLIDKSWSFDDIEQELSCLVEVEGDSNLNVLQIGGGIDDGFIYLLNNGTNDVAAAIDSYITQELNLNGQYVQLNMVAIRALAVAASAGDITVSFFSNGITGSTKTLTMAPEVTSQLVRRHLFPINIQDQNISIKIQNNAASKEMELLDVGLKTSVYEGR